MRPVAAPIHLSTTFHRNPDGSYNEGYVYSRGENPNRTRLEAALADLEGGAEALAFGSGLAAVYAIFQALGAGSHILLPDDVYYNVVRLAEEVFVPWGLEYTLVDMVDPTAVRDALRETTRLVWLETPSNPQLRVTDIKAISEILADREVLLAVDNTWPTPVLQQPLALGADVVMHSTTKYFGGHSDVLSGAVILREAGPLADRLRRIQTLGGGVPSPFDCWLVNRGIQTLHLRVREQTRTAADLAAYLAEHPAIERVNYPGLKSHPQHAVAQRQMPEGAGAMLSVLVQGGKAEAMRVANKLKLFATATSLGGVESLVEHRRSVEGPDSTTPDNLLRLSVGLEAVEDLVGDWERALQKH
ncbi:MAG: aminotransferase class I/II-fold pyridoxal phosphate-dependent enzyme, partial [Bacteroidota bacterium]